MLNIATWNCRGNPLNNQLKQRTLNQLLLNDIVLLQECGELASQNQYLGYRVYGIPQGGALNNRCSTAIITSEEMSQSSLFLPTCTGRYAVIGKFQDDKGQNFVVGNVHCAAFGAGALDRTQLLKFLSSEIERQSNIGGIIVGGDFNCPPPGNGRIQAGTRSRGILWEVVRPDRATHITAGIIDYFVYWGNFQNITVNRGRSTSGSDHYPVIATFS